MTNKVLSWVLFAMLLFVVIKDVFFRDKPVKIERKPDPELLEIKKEISLIKDGMMVEQKKRDSVNVVIARRLDSIKVIYIKSVYEKNKLKKLPDASLSAYNDSILRAAGLR